MNVYMNRVFSYSITLVSHFGLKYLYDKESPSVIPITMQTSTGKGDNCASLVQFCPVV